MKKDKQKDLFLLVIWNIIAFLLSFAFGFDYMIMAVWFFVVPSIYLSFKNSRLIKKSAIFSVLFSVPLTFIFDYLAHKDGAWQNFSSIDIYLFNLYPVDDFLWAILYIYYIVIFYEYFYDRDKDKNKIPKLFYQLSRILLLLCILFAVIIFVFPQIYIPYLYIWATLIFSIGFPYIIIKKYKKIQNKILPFLLYFFYMFMLYEYVANIKEVWLFPGQNFIGYFEILAVRFPLEEFLWALLAAPAILIYYEFFADDRK